MPDIRERFSALDQAEIPDLRPDIERRGHAGPSFEARRRPPVARRLVVACVALALALASFLLLNEAFRHTKNTMGHRSPPVVTPTVTNGEIWVRVGGGDGGAFVYTVDPGAGKATALFNDGSHAGPSPGTTTRIAIGEEYAWSPNGSRMAFSHYSGHGSEIFLLSVDGTSRTRLTHDGGLDAFPAWSPDGRLIAYGSDTTPPTTPGSKGYYTPGCEGSLSECPQQIRVVGVDGTGARQLTHLNGGATEPSWSPDGATIAFVGTGPDGNPHVFSMNADGTSPTQLTSGAAFDSSPEFSSDGTQIAFIRTARTGGANYQLMVMNADGSNLHVLAPAANNLYSFAWSPDGRQIAFAPYDSSGTLWLMSTDGKGLRKIVVAPGYGLGDIAWRPVPKTAMPSASPARLAVTRTLVLPEAAFGIATDQGSLWLAAYGHVIAVDPSGMTVTANIPVAHLDEQDGVAASAGTVWVTVGRRRKVVAIDEATGRIRATLPIPGNGVPVQVAADGSDVWVVSATVGNATLTHVDAATGRVTAQTQMQYSPKIPMVAALGVLWVSEGGRLWKIRPDGSATKVPGLAHVSALAFGDGSLWASANNALLRIDPATGKVEVTIPVFGDSLAVDGPLVWTMVARHRPSVIAVDARTNQVAGRLLHVGRSPSWLGAAAGSGFVLDFNGPNLVRIGAPTSATPSP